MAGTTTNPSIGVSSLLGILKTNVENKNKTNTKFNTSFHVNHRAQAHSQSNACVTLAPPPPRRLCTGTPVTILAPSPSTSAQIGRTSAFHPSPSISHMTTIPPHGQSLAKSDEMQSMTSSMTYSRSSIDLPSPTPTPVLPSGGETKEGIIATSKCTCAVYVTEFEESNLASPIKGRILQRSGSVISYTRLRMVLNPEGGIEELYKTKVAHKLKKKTFCAAARFTTFCKGKGKGILPNRQRQSTYMGCS